MKRKRREIKEIDEEVERDPIGEGEEEKEEEEDNKDECC